LRPRDALELLRREVDLVEVLVEVEADVLLLDVLRLRAGLRFRPPPVSLLTVAHALRAASRPRTPRFS
jgi:hypothetical protein